DKLVLTSVTPASSAPVLQTPKATSSTLYFDSLTVNAGNGGFLHCIQIGRASCREREQMRKLFSSCISYLEEYLTRRLRNFFHSIWPTTPKIKCSRCCWPSSLFRFGGRFRYHNVNSTAFRTPISTMAFNSSRN